MPLKGPVNKYKVVISFHEEGGTEYDPVYADDEEQAQEIALAMFKDRRREHDKLKNLRACALKSAKPY